MVKSNIIFSHPIIEGDNFISREQTSLRIIPPIVTKTFLVRGQFRTFSIFWGRQSFEQAMFSFFANWFGMKLFKIPVSLHDFRDNLMKLFWYSNGSNIWEAKSIWSFDNIDNVDEYARTMMTSYHVITLFVGFRTRLATWHPIFFEETAGKRTFAFSTYKTALMPFLFSSQFF